MLERYYAYKLVVLFGLFLIISAIWDLYSYRKTGTIKGELYSMKGRLYATIFTLITGIIFVLWPYL
jgi:hypothetical protein